jgi:hypothetical protein
MSKTNGSNGKNNDPAKLREQAKLLIEKAEQIERDKYIRIGKLAVKHYNSGFEGFDLTRFKKEIEAVL